MMTYPEAYVFGFIGALMAEFVYWAKFQQTFHKDKPEFYKSWYYWFIAIAWIVIGGFIPWIYLGMKVNINFLFCLHVGASAPIILNQFLSGKADSNIQTA
jgi:hypothetical protein